MNHLKAKVEANNNLHTVINELAPFLIRHFKQNEPKFKQDRTLYAKDKVILEELRVELKEKDNGVSFYTVGTNYGQHDRVELCFRISYQDVRGWSHLTSHITVYWEDTVEWTPKPLYTVEKVQDAANWIKECEKQIKTIEDAISQAKREVSPLLYQTEQNLLMATKLKILSDEDIHEYLYQSNVEEDKIPRRRKDKLTMAKKLRGRFRRP